MTLQPKTVVLTFTSAPSGLSLTAGSSSGTTPFTRTVIVNSGNSISAPSPQTLGGTNYQFSSWSDGGAATHNITAPATAVTYNATYVQQAVPPANTGLPAISGQARGGRSLKTSNGTWNGTTPLTFAYLWLRCDSGGNNCASIGGATGSSYTVQSADAGHRLRAQVTASNAGGAAAATSAATGNVKR